jgi:hypothetical protein
MAAEHDKQGSGDKDGSWPHIRKKVVVDGFELCREEVSRRSQPY